MKVNYIYIWFSVSIVTSNSVLSSNNPVYFKTLIGSKSVESSWEKDDPIDSIGFQFNYFPSIKTVGITADLYFSSNINNTTNSNSETSVVEANIGARWYSQKFSNLHLMPYLGAGISFAEVENIIELSGLKSTYNDSGVGYWIDSGVDYELFNNFYVGFDIRYSKIDLTINSQENNFGGMNYLASIAFCF
ncbi:outer membrane protein [Vibrio navarrensis]|uniref:outer membrane protein n=1 Tax=Vibrio navarrensis TaxID=29495 RepID=UPI0013023210|nr:OmpW family outer membrane protein [Vibrio navarrensis]EJL6568515.1 outer membrane beta-barrel protein [Vibrio navarrensis]